jgi:hypothetical protein
MDGLQRMIQKLSNDIVDLKKNARESSSYRRVWKPPFRRILHLLIIQIFLLEEIHIEEFSQDHYCQAHEANHSEKNCPTFINMFKVFVAMDEDEEGQTGDKMNKETIKILSHQSMSYGMLLMG